MKRGCNFSKLKRQNSDAKNDVGQTSKQQTSISKFFRPQNPKEATFDKLLNEKDKPRAVESTKRDDDDVEVISPKRLKKDPQILSSTTLDRLRSFTNGSDDSLQTMPKGKQKSTQRSKHFKSSRPNTKDVIEVKVEEDKEDADNKVKCLNGKRKVCDTSKVKYTPLEKQFMEIKAAHSDAILLVECGHKYRFFGEDAEIAAKELNIQCWLDHNFMTGWIPSYRLFVHVRRLVSKGYKVGVIKQIETASIKAASDNKNQLFERKLTALYTKSTLIGEDVEPLNDVTESSNTSESQQSHCLVALCEDKPVKNAADKIYIGLMAVNTVSGKLTYDYFEDNAMRSELDSRLAHLQPAELLCPIASFSNSTERLLDHWSRLERVNEDDRLRIERRKDNCFDYSNAIETVTSAYDSVTKKKDPLDLKTLLDLPKVVVCCLSALVTYLEEFLLNHALHFSRHAFSHYSEVKRSLKLDAATIRNLEIFANITDGKAYGSLFWSLNRTSTPFGSRLLRKWISHPLQNIKLIEERQDIVSELMNEENYFFSALKLILKKLPDLEKGLGTIYHCKCSPSMFLSIVSGLVEVSRCLDSYTEYIASHVRSKQLLKLLNDTTSFLSGIDMFISNLNENATKEGDKTQLFKDWSPFPAVVERKANIQSVIQKLKDLKPSIRQTLRVLGFEYVTVSNQEYLIEVKNAQLKAVPKSWVMISSTKQLSRYHSPEIVELLGQLNLQREHLTANCTEAWQTFLGDFNDNFHQYLQAVENVAAVDCYFSLSEVAKLPGYCRPFMVEHGTVINIEGGRHPVTSLLLPEDKQYVPNSTNLEVDKERCMIITGPNMGGKSSYIRQVGMIVLMAHVGSYVPADAATLGIIDGIFTRMGSRDELCGGQSTFMVEMQETRYIMSNATSRSLVILDELGRGTSTFDGVAIAQAVLNFFLTQIKCLMMFVTHYTILSELETSFPNVVGNYHLSFLINEHGDGDSCDELVADVVTFMYQVTKGAATNSYGLNVARLADVPIEVVKVAKQKSHQLEEKINKQRKISNLLLKLWKNMDELCVNESEFGIMDSL